MAINLDLIANQQQSAMLRAFLESVARIKNTTKLGELTALIEAQDTNGVVRLLGIDRASFESIENEIYQSYRKGGLTAVEQIGTIPTSYGEIQARFDMRSPAAEQWLATASSKAVVELAESQRELVRSVLTENLAQGVNPRTAALDLIGRIDGSGNRTGGFIGLTEQQAGWVSNARTELDNLNGNYFKRELRDKRLDSIVRKAIQDGKPLTAKQIDTAVTRMQNRALNYRGSVIARTESINALRAGQYESIKQAIALGEADTRDVKRIWDASGDDRTRLDHLVMEDQERGAEEPFTFPDGSQAMFAGDDSLGAPAKQLIQCRCRVNTRIDFLGQLKRLDGFR